MIPWEEHTYVGTTDTDYDGPLDDPTCTDDEAAYLLDALNGVTTVKATSADIVGSWAGLRPLLSSARHARSADLSRRHGVHVAPSGVVTVTGGKLTTYRRMAADAVDAAVRVLDHHVAAFGDQASPAPRERRRRSRRRRTRPPHRPLRDGGGGDPGARRRRSRARRAPRARSRVPPRRGRLRGAPRDGAHARRRALAADPCPRPGARRVDRRRIRRRRSHRARAGLVRRRASNARCATTARPPARSSRDTAASARRRAQCDHGGHRDHDRDGGAGFGAHCDHEADADDHRPRPDHHDLGAAPRVQHQRRVGRLRQRLRVRNPHRAGRLAATVDGHRPPRADPAPGVHHPRRASARSS